MSDRNVSWTERLRRGKYKIRATCIDRRHTKRERQSYKEMK